MLYSAMKASRGATSSKPLSQNVEDWLDKTTSMDWTDHNDDRFKFPFRKLGTKSVSDGGVDCLSDEEQETFVQKTYTELRQAFEYDANIPQISIKNLIKKVYRIMRHPRQRPAFKNLFRQAFHGNDRHFEDGWRQLLFLTRIFHAAVAFVDLAKSQIFTSIMFRQIPVAAAFSLANTGRRSPIEVLETLGYSSPTRPQREFLQSSKVKQFLQLARVKKTVHAEIQLIFYVENLNHSQKTSNSEVYPYIGCSRKCCFFCELFRIQHGTFDARGTHHALFPLWALPEILPPQSIHLLRGFASSLRDMLRSIFSLPTPLQKRDLLQQSSDAMSTAQAVQSEAPKYSTRPQTSTYVSIPE